MGTRDSVAHARVRRTPLAGCLSAVLAIGSIAPAPAATPAENLLHRQTAGLAPLFEKLGRRAAAVRATRHGTRRPQGGIVIPVTSCADDGAMDTLRHAVLIASSGDTVDLGGLACSTITLAAGAIGIDVDDLAIEGPGASRLTIDAGHASRIFRHGGAGTLQITNLTVANGSYSPPTGPFGGACIYSAATVSMTGAVATGCTASAEGTIAGGAVLALDSLIMFGSAITDSQVTSTSGYSGVAAAGGAAFAQQEIVFEHSIISGNSAGAPLGNVYAGGLATMNVIAKYSTVHGNTATTVTGASYYAVGGGLFATQNVFVEYSTFDGNTADGGGGVLLRTSPGYAQTFRNTTLSGNHANILAGAMLVQSDITIENSTIAFNTGGTAGGGGVIVEGTTAELQSTIIADNSPSATMAAADLDGSAAVTGANNLVKVSGITMPPDTITTDPQLGPLAANGGQTRTHALPPASVAIDVGNNAAGALFDQRGPGFPRGVGALPDIGAFELDTDVIFDDGFDAGGG